MSHKRESEDEEGVETGRCVVIIGHRDDSSPRVFGTNSFLLHMHGSGFAVTMGERLCASTDRFASVEERGKPSKTQTLLSNLPRIVWTIVAR